jgi:putative transposase
MVRYRRQRIPGGCFFFTVTLRDRRATWLTDHIDLLRDAMRITASRRPFRTEAIVILPEHLHTLWTLPPDNLWQRRYWEHTIRDEDDFRHHVDYRASRKTVTSGRSARSPAANPRDISRR